MTDTALPESGASAADSMSGVSSAEFWTELQNADSEQAAQIDPPQGDAQEAEAQEADANESESSTDETEHEEAQAGKPAKGVQKRLNELTRERHEANRRAQAAEAQLSQALELIQRFTDGQQPPKSTEKRRPDLSEEAPNPEDYMNGDQFDALGYQRDLAEHLAERKVSEKLAEIQRRQEQEAAARAQAQQQAEFHAKSAEVAKSHPDYWDAIEAAKAHPFFQTPVSALIVADANGAELAYELAKAPEQMDQLVNLPPQLALMQLGRISAGIDARKAAPPPAPRISKAPPPPNPVTRASANTDNGYLGRDDLSFGDWEVRRNAELRGARAR